MTETDLGKLFIGGISWDTDEERLKEYFTSYGEVVEAVIMRDHNTGRARGFGFVVFANPVVAERVISEKHIIDELWQMRSLYFGYLKILRSALRKLNGM